MKRHARPMADYRRAQRRTADVREATAILADALAFLAMAAALLAVVTYSGPPPY